MPVRRNSVPVRVGGPVGDRIGRKKVIWASILGVLPFTLALRYASLDVTVALSVIIGVVISSAFPAIVVYAQELIRDAREWCPAYSSD